MQEEQVQPHEVSEHMVTDEREPKRAREEEDESWEEMAESIKRRVGERRSSMDVSVVEKFMENRYWEDVVDKVTEDKMIVDIEARVKFVEKDGHGMTCATGSWT